MPEIRYPVGEGGEEDASSSLPFGSLLGCPGSLFFCDLFFKSH